MIKKCRTNSKLQNLTVYFFTLLFPFQIYGWSVDVEELDAPIGQKRVYGMLKNEEFEIPDLKDFSCTVLKNKYAKNPADVHFRSLVCVAQNNPNHQFGIRTDCTPNSAPNNNLQISTMKNKKIVGYSISLSCQ